MLLGRRSFIRTTASAAALAALSRSPLLHARALTTDPKLDDLTDGDLRYQIDFRSVYAGLLDDWLGVDSRGVLGEKPPPLPAKLVDLDKKVEPNTGGQGGPPVPGGPLPATPPTPAKN